MSVLNNKHKLGTINNINIIIHYRRLNIIIFDII